MTSPVLFISGPKDRIHAGQFVEGQEHFFDCDMRISRSL